MWKDKSERLIIHCTAETKLSFLKFKMEGKFSNNEKALNFLLQTYEASKVKFK
jgi:hypothetical protein